MRTHHRQLTSWKTGVDLVEVIYRSTQKFPESERFGLAGQARRAAVSVPANIAEGSGRGSRAEYVRYLRVARSSLAELETHIIIAERLGFLGEAEMDRLLDQTARVGQLINGQIRALLPATKAHPS